MAYKISATLRTLDEPRVAFCLTAEEAAIISWKICGDHRLRILDDASWKMKKWDIFEGRYVTSPCAHHMIRGSRGTFMDQTEWSVQVISDLGENTGLAPSFTLPGTTKAPVLPPTFEVFRGGEEKITIKWDESADGKAVALGLLGETIEAVIQDAETDEDDLIAMLEDKLKTARNQTAKPH